MPTYSTRPAVPVDALRLSEDVATLKLCVRLLRTVDRYNVDEDPDSDVLWMAIQKLSMCQRYAERKLRTTYLDPRKRKLNGR